MAKVTEVTKVEHPTDKNGKEYTVLTVIGKKGPYRKAIFDQAIALQVSDPGMYQFKYSDDGKWNIIGVIKGSTTVTVPQANGNHVVKQTIDPGSLLREKYTTARCALMQAVDYDKKYGSPANGVVRIKNNASELFHFMCDLAENSSSIFCSFINGIGFSHFNFVIFKN